MFSTLQSDRRSDPIIIVIKLQEKKLKRYPTQAQSKNTEKISKKIDQYYTVTYPYRPRVIIEE